MALRSPFRRRCACSCESALESWKSRKTRPPAALTAATARAPAGPALALAGGPRLPLRRGSARRDFAGRSCTTSPSAKSAAATKSTTPQSLARGRHARNTSLPEAATAAQAPRPRIAAGVQAARRRAVYFPADLSLRPLSQVYKQPGDARRATGTRTSRKSSPASSRRRGVRRSAETRRKRREDLRQVRRQVLRRVRRRIFSSSPSSSSP